MARVTPLLCGTSHHDLGVTTSTTLSISRQSGLKSDDVLFVYLNSSAGGNGAGWSASGWTALGAAYQSGSRAWGWFYRAIADISQEPSSYSFSYTGTAGRVTGDIIAYRNVDAASIGTTGSTVTYYSASNIQTGIPGWTRSESFVTTNGATVLYAANNNIAASYASAPTATPDGYTAITFSVTAGDTTVARTMHWIGSKVATSTSVAAARTDWSYVASSTAAHSISFLGVENQVIGGLAAGGSAITSVYLGAQSMNRLYLGATQLWPLGSPPVQSFISNLDTYGDSLTAGFAIGAGNSWPAQLEGMLTGVTVSNFGISGHSALEIAVRQGGMPLDLTFPGNSIPASGSVTVTATPISWGNTPCTVLGTVAGVSGSLSHSSGQAGLNKTEWTFTRQGSGSAVSVGSSASFRSSADHNVPLVILAGRNDIGQGADNTTAINRVLNAYAAMAGYNSSGKVLALSNTTTTNETATGLSRVNSINAALQSTYGNNYLDVHGWLLNHGLSELGITPTNEDTQNIAAGKLPPSLMVDTIHWSAATAGLVAQLIKNKLVALGWTSS